VRETVVVANPAGGLAEVRYSSRAHDLVRYLSDPVYDRVAAVVSEFVHLDSDGREAARNTLNAGDCYTLLTFSRRRSTEALRQRSLPLANDALMSVCAVTRSSIDFRDVSIDFPLYALAQLGGGVGRTLELGIELSEVQAAAFGLEQAYVSLFVDAGFLTGNAAASRTVDAYVRGLQQDLTTLGLYTASIDGLYGPATVTAVKALQASAGLSQTGIVDPATETAIAQQLAAKGKQQSLNIAALQGARPPPAITPGRSTDVDTRPRAGTLVVPAVPEPSGDREA
jgi:hypothetical protein